MGAHVATCGVSPDRVEIGPRLCEVAPVRASHNDYAPPSTIGGSMELDALERFSCVICDSLTLTPPGQTRMKSASVSRRVLAGIMANPTTFGQMKFSIEQARMYANESLGISSGFSKTQLQVNKALVNVAGLLLESSVEATGRVSIEADPRLAHDAAGLKKNADVIWGMCAENGIPKDRILIQMPATWEAIEAAEGMELEGLQTHLVDVYSYGQAVAAIDHGVSVLQLNVGRINDWYDRNPGAIRDSDGAEGGCGDGQSRVRRVGEPGAAAGEEDLQLHSPRWQAYQADFVGNADQEGGAVAGWLRLFGGGGADSQEPCHDVHARGV